MTATVVNVVSGERNELNVKQIKYTQLTSRLAQMSC